MGSAVNISSSIVCGCGPTSGIHISDAIDHSYTHTPTIAVPIAKVIPLPHVGVIPVSVSISVAGGGGGNEAHVSRRVIGRVSELVGAPSIGPDAQIHTINRDALIGPDDDTDIKCYRTTHSDTGDRRSNGNTDCQG